MSKTDPRTMSAPGRAAEMERVVRRYFECLNTDDWTGMAELWCADCELRAVGARPRLGSDSAIGYFSRLFKPWPDHHDEPIRLIISPTDETVVAEVTFTGRTPDGRDVTFDAIDVFDLEGQQIKKMTNWYDIDFARRSLAPQETDR